MSVTETDLDLLHSYIDGEMPVSECEGLWRRLSVEADLLAELERIRADHAMRQAFWPTLEPADSEVARLETNVMRSVRRHDVFIAVRRVASIVTGVAACLLFGFTVGWLGHDKFIHMPAGATSPMALVDQTSDHLTNPASGKYLVSIKDEGGHLVASQSFNSMEEARQFADDVNRAQASEPDSRDSAVVPAVAKF